jgi:hypothetical protein
MKHFLIPVLLLASLLQGGGQPIVIPITNPSFEQMNAIGGSDSCGARSAYVPGWSGPIWIFTPVEPNNPCHIQAPPDGANAALIGYGDSLLQDTGISASSLQAASGVRDVSGYHEGLYTLTFYEAGYLWAYPAGYYEAKISLGTTDQYGVIHPGNELCSTDGWGTEIWHQVTLVCPSPAYIVFNKWPSGYPEIDTSSFDPNAHLIVSLSNVGWPVLFDSVSLTFTPQ